MMRGRSLGWLLVLAILTALPAMAADTLSVVINEGATYATSRKVAVALTYEGEELPTQMRVFSGTWSEWTAYTPSFKWTLEGAEGERSIIVETKYWIGIGWRIRSAEDTIILDVTPPAITSTLTPEANEYGWYNEDVTLRFQATDAASGVAYVTNQMTFGVVANHLAVTGYAIDAAGNEATLVVRDIKIDTTAPTLTPIVVPGVADDIWTPGPVVITFDPVDELSGIAYVTGQLTVEGIADHVTMTGFAMDKAGNTGSIDIGNINIDSELATTTIAFAPGIAGPVNVQAKLDAFGTYDRNSLAVGLALPDPDLNVTLTVMGYDALTGKYTTIMTFRGCEYSAVSGLYQVLLPMERLVSGEMYELWFEEIGAAALLTVLVKLP